MVPLRSFLPAVVGLALFLAGPTAVRAAAGERVEQARERLQAGQAEQAYELLAAAEADYAGNVEFDYWLGLAAVRAGEFGHAVFALERVLASSPDHAGARLELATAYVALDQNREAARQLDHLRTLDPPPGAAERIEQLAIEVRRRNRRASRQDKLFYVALEAGHDNNVGTYPDDFSILPGLLPPVDAIDSAFLGARLGGTRNFRLAPDQQLGVTGQLYHRDHTPGSVGQDNAEPFDHDFGLLRLSWMKDVDGRQELEAGLEASRFRLDGDEYYSLLGLYGLWRYRGTNSLTYDVDFRARDIAFEAGVNDYRYYSFQPGIEYQFTPRWRVDANLAFELESANKDRLGGDAQILGLRAKSRYALDSRNMVEASVEYERAQYQQPFAVGTAFNPQPEDRDDDRIGVTFGWAWFPHELWRTRLEARYREQESSLDLYTYERTLGKFSVTRFF